MSFNIFLGKQYLETLLPCCESNPKWGTAACHWPRSGQDNMFWHGPVSTTWSRLVVAGDNIYTDCWSRIWSLLLRLCQHLDLLLISVCGGYLIGSCVTTPQMVTTDTVIAITSQYLDLLMLLDLFDNVSDTSLCDFLAFRFSFCFLW